MSMPAASRVTAALVVALLALPGAALAKVPPPIPHGRALAALASHETVLLGATPGIVAALVVNEAGGMLVSGPLSIWEVPGASAPHVVSTLERLGLLRYAEPSRTRAVLGHTGSADPLLDEAWHLDRAHDGLV
jgi:hypothetical protein